MDIQLSDCTVSINPFYLIKLISQDNGNTIYISYRVAVYTVTNVINIPSTISIFLLITIIIILCTLRNNHNNLRGHPVRVYVYEI